MIGIIVILAIITIIYCIFGTLWFDSKSYSVHDWHEWKSLFCIITGGPVIWIGALISASCWYITEQTKTTK